MEKRDKESGFTLIELLVVIIIIGILAAIAIPAFLSQKNKAKDASAKSDATNIGKQLATYYVDGTSATTVSTVTGGYEIRVGSTVVDSGKLSSGNAILANSKGLADGSWCVAIQASSSNNSWRFQNTTGLTANAACPA